jgi:ABC-type phosphate/phosphonate transport system substrate-binding protein
VTLVHAKCFWSGAASQQDSPTFVFTAIADQNETRLVERSRRVAEYLQSKFAMPVKYLPVKSYRAAITAFINSEPMPTRLSEAPGEAGIGRRLGVERLPCKA